METLRGPKKNTSCYQTPPPKIAAPSPAKAASSKVPPPERPAPVTEGAKLNRLRRMCEKKPSGRCNVPDAIHQRWKESTKEQKEAMIEELEKANWSKERPPIISNPFQQNPFLMVLGGCSIPLKANPMSKLSLFQVLCPCLLQDLFVSRITKTITQKKTLARKQKRGWFTKELMSTTLGWSAPLPQVYVQTFHLFPMLHSPDPPAVLSCLLCSFLLLLAIQHSQQCQVIHQVCRGLLWETWERKALEDP